MITTPPQPTKVYQNHHLDSTRWESFAPRDDDIVISTSYKSGTTWMQMIVMNLLVNGSEYVPLQTISPWLDMRLGQLDEVMPRLEEQRHRRFIKTHLPLDGLRFFPQVKYVVVGRDARDVMHLPLEPLSELRPRMCFSARP